MRTACLSPQRASRLAFALGPLLSVVAFAALGAVSATTAQAATAAGAFQVTLSGTQTLGQTAPVSGGDTARRVSYALRTSGGYPRLVITVSQGRETLYPAGQPQTVTGPNGGKIQVIGVIQATGSAIDPVGGSKLFDLALRGAILPDNSEALRFTSPASDPTSSLDFTVTFPSSEDSSVSGTASGTLTLAPNTDPAIVDHIWGTTPPSSAAQPSDDPTLWYITRGAASTAYALLTVVVALGIALGFQGFSGLVRAWRINDLHQVLTLLMLAFVALHLATLFLDPAKPFSLLQLAWPLGETYRPLWTALGVLALYLLLVITLSSYLRRALGARTWFALHLLSYVAFVLVTLHGIFTGTDTTTPWMLGVYTAASALVLLLTVARIYLAGASRRPQRDPAATRPVDPAGIRQ